MNDKTQNPTPDDTEGNTARTGHAPAVTTDDTEGNTLKSGHGPAVTDDTDDTDVDGNSMRWSDAEIKHDVTPVSTPKTDDDTEGNVVGSRHVPAEPTR
jgi:hypothetical protein